MDTTEIYIKMADCPEIQKHKQFDVKSYFGQIKYKAKPKNNEEIGVSDEAATVIIGTLVWLPRQDQAQKSCLCIRGKNGKQIFSTLAHLFGRFSHFVSSASNFRRFDSFEKLWLAFYMYEKHGLKWNGNEWT